ncbi:MotA/TolQ/ExbB proton channel family protein [Photobacterium sp. SDRW27]|uniref:MotA/TolQ/ExbB proton channel family protein n=1 Tax=Photobacterium obscurum TaxID=2829490 RepID=UPI0022435A6D|nr:MotA/TolQ/ExbB proton channel family protein [Photobacterium obscurum]MCW8331715.1 MotA/TolQ/ExbB proton channel family protein [Photobacterium obscurum]
MKIKALAISLCLFTLPFAASATSTLVEKTQQEQQLQKAHNAKREAGFKLTEKEIKQQRDALIAQRDQLQRETQQLSNTFSGNENKLAKLEEQLRLETGSLGELFGVVRQTAKEMQAEINFSVTGADRTTYHGVVEDIVDAKALPSMKQLTGLWQGMTDQIVASSELREVSVPFINGEGYQSDVNAYRLGSIGLIGEQGYLSWDGKRQVAKPYLKQPENGPAFSTLNTLTQSGLQAAVVDPSRGVMLEQLANSPELSDRIEHGGVVGKIILGLLAVGGIIALFRGAKLVVIRQQIKAQLKNPSQPGNNPLGRVLGVYSKEQNRTVEALELRLLETIVDEQQGLEKGLSMLKLLAALAPMLGLLGTVTGMIETFQVITQFGNGDPTVMAGGISMALVTTVLGLVAAMPLLLAHNILSTQADTIRNILEKQGISLVAEQAEKAGSAA